ncbi:MAG TPA: DUF2939 domain-containing protein [Sphingomicrobium sp.]|nr:DUF2939 domain-containing protein [Sphingomicrobium sp.]
MRFVALVFGLLIAGFVGWYEASPRYTLNEMRKAAAAGNAAKLSKWVDYQALKIDMKGEIRRELLLEANRRGVERNPLVRLGVELIPAGVDLLVTPEAVQAMFDAKSAASTTGRGPAAADSKIGVMPVAIPKADIVIERHGLSAFKVKTKGKDGAAVFRRYGFGWKLAGVDMPYRFSASTPGP